MTSYLLGLATGIAIGVYIGLRLVWAGEPAVESYADAARTSDGWDEAAGMCPNCVTPWKCNGPHVPWPPFQTGDGRLVPPETDDWATDPHLTTLTEGGNPR